MCMYKTKDGKYLKYSDNNVLSFCIDGPCPDEAQTNADRIRAMTDEELAKFLCDFRTESAGDHYCAGCKAESYCRTGHNGMIDWLQQPAKEE